MTRKEKEEAVQREDGKAFNTYAIDIEQNHLSPSYQVVKRPSHAISGTGLLKVFELTGPPNGPSFVGRWDGGSRGEGQKKKFDLDIDIRGVSPTQEYDFKHCKNGYAGHHADRVESDRGWKYQVRVRTPEDGLIFEATVCFNLHRKVGLADNLSVSDVAERDSSLRQRRKSNYRRAPFRDTLEVRNRRRTLRKCLRAHQPQIPRLARPKDCRLRAQPFR